MYAEPWEPQRGERLLGRYEITKKLGEGAWGTVYLAYDMTWDVKGLVAIKHLRPEIVRSNPGSIDWFKRELKIIMNDLRGLPQVVHAYDFNNIDEMNYFYIMDYIEGGSLRDLLDKQRVFLILDAIDTTLDICGALEDIHERSVIHNDLKPSNILIPAERTKAFVMISDFGSASPKGSRGYIGTKTTGPSVLYYSSPELLNKEPVDERSDLYAVGVMLYEMIVGEVPFLYEEKVDLVSRIRNDPPTLPSSRQKSVSDALDEVILKALKKHPGERYTSAGEMISALREVRKIEAQRQEKKQELYKMGISYLEAEKWQAAIECFDEINETLDPNYRDVAQLLERARQKADLEPRYIRIEALFRQTEWETAIGELEEIIRIDESYRNVQALLNDAQKQHKLAELHKEAIWCEQNGKWTAAVGLYLKIMDIDPRNRDVGVKVAEAKRQIKLEGMHQRVDECLHKRELEKAIQVLEEILRIEPDYPGTVERLREAKQQKEMWASYIAGMMHFHDKQWDLAIKCFEEVSRCVPASLDENILGAALNLSPEETLSKVPIYMLASVRLAQAKKLQKISIAFDEAKVYLCIGKYKKAIARLDEVLSLDGKHQEALRKRKEAKQRLRPTKPGVSPSLPSWEKVTFVAVLGALVVGLTFFVIINIVQIDIPQYVWFVLGIVLIGLGGFLAFRFPKEEQINDQS